MNAIPIPIADQVRAAAAAVAAMRPQGQHPFVAKPSDVRYSAKRFQRADALRRIALALLATRESCTLIDLVANHTEHSTTGQWQWIVKTLVDPGYVVRLPRRTRSLAARFAITPAGRQHLAAQSTPQPVTTGAH